VNKTGYFISNLRGEQKFYGLLALWICVFGVLLLASAQSYAGVNVGIVGYTDSGAVKAGLNITGPILEDVNYVVNLTLNSTNGTIGTDATNITQINITLPTGFSYVSGSLKLLNVTGIDSANFGNLDGWGNYSVSTPSSSQIVINATKNGTSIIKNDTGVQLWFTVNASTPGNYTFNITLINGSGVGVGSIANSSLLHVIVNDTTVPSLLEIKTNNTASSYTTLANNTYIKGNISGTWLFINVSAYDNGALRAAVFRLSKSINATNITLNQTHTNTTFAVYGAQEKKLQANFSFISNNLSDGVYFLNITVNDTWNNVKVSDTLTLTIDSVIPVPSYGTGTNLNGTYSNSSNITINISTTDVNLNFTNVSLYNATGVIRSNLTRFSSSTPTYIVYNEVPDGTYYFNASTNDSAGNYNGTLWTRTITVDWHAPVITFSCTPTNLKTEDTVTCSCSAADTIDSSPTVTYTANPSTSDTGTITTYCVAGDDMNNSATASFDYLVEFNGVGGGSFGGSSGGGGGATTWKSTTIIQPEQASSGYSKSMAAKEKVSVPVSVQDSSGATSTQNHYVGVVSVNSSANKAVIEIASANPVRVTMTAGETKKFEVTGDNYYDLQITLDSIAASKANVTIKAVHELVPTTTGETGGAGTTGTTETGGAGETTTPTSYNWLWWTIGVIVVLAIIVVIVMSMGKKR